MSDSVDSYHGTPGGGDMGNHMGLEVRDGDPVVLAEGEKLTPQHREMIRRR